MYSLISLILFAFLAKGAFSYSIDDESKLQSNLLQYYYVNVRPADQVAVNCALSINNIISLDIVDQTLSVIGSLTVIWNDPRLSWNLSEHKNVSDVYFKLDEIWRPTLVLENSVTGVEVIGDDSNQKSIHICANPIGFLFWLAPAYFQSHCSVDISKFPFDTQKCEIVISTWMFSTNIIKLNHLADTINMERFQQNGEYDVVRTYTRLDTEPFYEVNLEYLVFGIELRRKSSFYLINIVLPVFFMQLLGVVVFAVPSDSGEKLSFSLTLLLSLTVMMTLVAEKIPTTSLQIPTLSVYMLGGTIISSLELIMTVYILHLKHHKSEGVSMSKNMKAFAKCIAFLVCMERRKIDNKEETFQITVNKCSLVMVEGATNEGVLEKTAPETNDADTPECNLYTYEDLSIMMGRFSVILFGFLTVTFTLAMLFRIR